MKLSPKASSMERNVRGQIRGLSLVAWVLLLGCMTMTAMFGWSLGRNLVEKLVTAGALAAIDLAGALLMNPAAPIRPSARGPVCGGVP
jgi:hypothetical protein